MTAVWLVCQYNLLQEVLVVSTCQDCVCYRCVLQWSFVFLYIANGLNSSHIRWCFGVRMWKLLIMVCLVRQTFSKISFLNNIQNFFILFFSLSQVGTVREYTTSFLWWM